jgi:hypothetical protein
MSEKNSVSQADRIFLPNVSHAKQNSLNSKTRIAIDRL